MIRVSIINEVQFLPSAPQLFRPVVRFPWKKCKNMFKALTSAIEMTLTAIVNKNMNKFTEAVTTSTSKDASKFLGESRNTRLRSPDDSDNSGSKYDVQDDRLSLSYLIYIAGGSNCIFKTGNIIIKFRV